MAEVLRDGGPRKREGGGARSGWRFDGFGGERVDILLMSVTQLPFRSIIEARTL